MNLLALLLVLGVHGLERQEAWNANPSAYELPETLPLEVEPVRALKYCGVQAVCIVAHLYGKPVDFDEVLAEICVTDRGSSLQSMERFLTRISLEFEAVEADSRLLRDVNRPFIAHLKRSAETAHYVVVLSSRDGFLLFLDPSRRLYGRTDVGSFSRLWSGYALVPADMTGAFSSVPLVSGGLIALALFAMAAVLHRRRRARVTES